MTDSEVTDSREEQLHPLVGQIESRVRPGHPFSIRLPSRPGPQFETLSGLYFLARCSTAVGTERGDDFSVFPRLPLFVCGRQAHDKYDRWQVYSPANPAENGTQPEPALEGGRHSRGGGSDWLAQRASGDLLNLLGPFGNGFDLMQGPQNLLILVDIREEPSWFWLLLPLCEQALDRGSRVTLLIRTTDDGSVSGLVRQLPVQVEARTVSNERQWLDQIQSTIAWSDQLCAGVPPEFYGDLLGIVKSARFRVDRNFAQVLVRADLLCGVGACLACAVPTARGGYTRACVHGPVFDLTALAA